MNWKKKYIAFTVVLCVIAFIVRIAAGFELLSKDLFVSAPPATTDMATYLQYAEEIINGNFQGPFSYQPFYYVVFLPLIFFFFGKSIAAVIVIQALLGALSVFFATLASARLFGKTAGFFTAVILTFSATLIGYTPYALMATLQGFWIVLLLYLIVRSSHEYNTWRWALVGFVAGVSILTRGNSWFFVPGLLFLALYLPGRASGRSACKSERHKYIPPLLLIIFLILPQIPFVCYNSAVTGELCGPSTAARKVLALGNTPEAPPGGRIPGSTGPGPMEYPETWKVWLNADSDVSVYRRITKWFAEEPLAFVELTFRKLLLFWDAREIPNNICLEYNCSRSIIFRVFGFIPGFLPLALALAGIIFYLARVRRDLKFVALVYFICAYWLSTSAFYILSRFRVPLLPVLGIPAGAFIAGNLMLLKSKKRWKFYFFSIPCLLFGLFITMVAYDGYQEYLEAYISAIARPSGVSLKIDDGKYMYLDNSPYSCGGWRVLKMKRGMFCAKKFAVPAEMNFSGAVFSLFLFCENPGEAEFRLNGKKHTIDFSKGLFEKKFSISQFSDLIKFELVRSSAEIYIFTDSRRNYGRTHINGKKTKSEIVCRLYGLKNNYTGKSK